MADDFTIHFRIDKAKSEGRIVRGWAYVCSDNGKPVVDWSGQHADMDVIEKAAHDFMLNARIAKHNHTGEQTGDIVESVMVDDDLCKALGASTTKRGWWIGMEIHDADIRKAVKAGDLSMFSIGGRGKLVDAEIEA